MTFQGVGVALVTPFIKNKVNYEVLTSLLDFHMHAQTNYLVILGSTAEAQTITDAERKKIIQFVVSYVNKRVRIIVGTGTNDTKSSIYYAKQAKNYGADGILVVTPYYNKPTQEGMYLHYKKIAKSVDLPVILYNVPSRTGINLEVNTVVKLADIKNIVAIKEASGNLKQVKEIIDKVQAKLEVLSGNDDELLATLKLGGKGIISVTANIIPGVIKNQIDNYFKGIDITESINNYLELHQTMFIETNPIVVKQALNHIGFNVGIPRLPLTKITKKHDKVLLEVLKKYRMVNHD